MNLTVICPGKLKEAYLRDAVAEYEKRLALYGKVQIIELNPVKLPENPSQAEIQGALEKEAEMMESKIPRGAYTYALCVEGAQRSSEDFAEELKSLCINRTGSFCFLIGSSFGLSPALKQRADARISFSKMTFPHQLMRVLLLEQLYRANQILTGGKYHK